MKYDSTETYQPRRTFSLREANQALPLVQRITKDIVEAHRKISETYAQSHRLAEEGRYDEAEDLNREIAELLEAVESYVEELERIGCEYKDRTNGLVDFPARMGDKLVYLCWKLGEPEILYWHELHAGFAGRQPVAGHFSKAN